MPRTATKSDDEDVDTTLLNAAHRLYLADLEVAEGVLAQAQADLMTVQRRVNDFYDRVKEIKDNGIKPYLDTLEGK